MQLSMQVSIPLQGSGNETPRSSNYKHANGDHPPSSAFSNADDRPFGVALGLDPPEHPSRLDGQIDERLFIVKVDSRSAAFAIDIDAGVSARWSCRLPCIALRYRLLCQHRVGPTVLTLFSR